MSTSPINSATLPRTLEVQPDDTLSEIAEENGLSLDQLLKLNPQFEAAKIDGKLDATRVGHSGWDPDFIRPGDTIILRKSADATGADSGTNGSVAPTSFDSAAPVSSPGSKQGKIREAMRYFQSQGWSKEQAAGIIGNLQAESGLNPSIPGDGGAAYGIGQWHPDRQANFQRVIGHSIRGSSFGDQLKFVQWELTHTESGAGNALRGADSASEAAAIFCRLYERPADIVGQSRYRGTLAQQIMASA
jgi:hypothetical protein